MWVLFSSQYEKVANSDAPDFVLFNIFDVVDHRCLITRMADVSSMVDARTASATP